MKPGVSPPPQCLACGLYHLTDAVWRRCLEGEIRRLRATLGQLRGPR